MYAVLGLNSPHWKVGTFVSPSTWMTGLLVCAVFFPAALACVAVFLRGRPAPERMWALLVILLQPAAVLIDHGHFQYNNISLGLSVRAYVCL